MWINPPATPAEATQAVGEFFEPLVNDQLTAIEAITGVVLQPGQTASFGFVVGRLYDDTRQSEFLDVRIRSRREDREPSRASLDLAR